MYKFLLGIVFFLSNSLVASELPSYNKNDALKNQSFIINSIGSDTLAGLITFWSEGFQKYYPNTQFQIQAAGSSTGPVALIEGTSDLAPMSREMKDSELQSFQKKYGYPPTRIAVAIDALGVFVNKANPIEHLSMHQLDSIFSANQSCGGKPITNWSQLGIKLQKDTIALYGRNSVSGTYVFFKDTALCKGDFRQDINEQPGSSSVVQSIAKSTNAIGYSSVGYTAPDVKLISITGKNGKIIAPNQANITKGVYPLARLLYIYINKPPKAKLNPMVKEFLRFILSKQGQDIVSKDGFTPLSSKLVNDNLVLLK